MLMERLDREGDVDDDGRFHPGGPEWWDLDGGEPDETRERWLRTWLADGRDRSLESRPVVDARGGEK